jgi:capsular exopolysaccharide synthesis family protein
VAEKPWPEPPRSEGPDRPVRQIRTRRPAPRLDPQDALSILWRHKGWILAITLLMTGVALYVSNEQTSIYESRAEVLVEAIADVGSDAVAPREPNLATEAELVTSAAVAEIVADNLGLDSSSELVGDVSVDQPTDTEILGISYRHIDPQEARRRAQAFAEGYLEYRQGAATAEVANAIEGIDSELQVLRERLREIQETLLEVADDDPRLPGLNSEAALIQDDILQRQLALLSLTRASVRVGDVVEPASLPRSPVSPNHVVNGAFGLFAGLALAVGLVFVRDRLSGRIRSIGEIEDHMQAPVLGSIPRVPAWRKRKEAYLVTLRQWQSPGSEAFRALRTNVLSAASTHGVKTIVVTSAHDGEGKSATVANLAVVLARAGKRVTVVSADLRRPRLHLFFGSKGTLGLADVLGGRVPASQTLEDVTLATSPWIEPSGFRLRLLPSGHVPEDPAELLATETLEKLLEALATASDMVLIDAPPVLPVTDALIVARVADGVLYVIGPRSSTVSSLTSARQQFDNVGARVLGIVLNGPDASMTQTYGY